MLDFFLSIAQLLVGLGSWSTDESTERAWSQYGNRVETWLKTKITRALALKEESTGILNRMMQFGMFKGAEMMGNMFRYFPKTVAKTREINLVVNLVSIFAMYASSTCYLLSLGVWSDTVDDLGSDSLNVANDVTTYYLLRLSAFYFVTHNVLFVKNDFADYLRKFIGLPATIVSYFPRQYEALSNTLQTIAHPLVYVKDRIKLMALYSFAEAFIMNTTSRNMDELMEAQQIYDQFIMETSGYNPQEGQQQQIELARPKRFSEWFALQPGRKQKMGLALKKIRGKSQDMKFSWDTLMEVAVRSIIGAYIPHYSMYVFNTLTGNYVNHLRYAATIEDDYRLKLSTPEKDSTLGAQIISQKSAQLGAFLSATIPGYMSDLYKYDEVRRITNGFSDGDIMHYMTLTEAIMQNDEILLDKLGPTPQDYVFLNITENLLQRSKTGL
jgi:hypothetical protein